MLVCPSYGKTKEKEKRERKKNTQGIFEMYYKRESGTTDELIGRNHVQSEFPKKMRSLIDEITDIRTLFPVSYLKIHHLFSGQFSCIYLSIFPRQFYSYLPYKSRVSKVLHF